MREYADFCIVRKYLFRIVAGTVVAEQLKRWSSRARAAWLSGVQLDPKEEQLFGVFNRTRMSVWSYLGRALPPKGPEGVADTIKGFLRHPKSRPPPTRYISEVSQVLSYWYSGGEDVKLPVTASNKAAIGLPRRMGGQREMIRQLGVLSGLLRDESIAPPGPLGGQGWRDERYHSIAGIIYDLEREFVTHSMVCPGEYCMTPELHFPYLIQDLPEKGHRRRKVSLPWYSLCYLQEPFRRSVINGLKRSRISGPPLTDNWKVVAENKYNRRVINSVDMKSSTDNLRHELGNAWGFLPHSVPAEYVHLTWKSARIGASADWREDLLPPLTYMRQRYDEEVELRAGRPPYWNDSLWAAAGGGPEQPKFGTFLSCRPTERRGIGEIKPYLEHKKDDMYNAWLRDNVGILYLEYHDYYTTYFKKVVHRGLSGIGQHMSLPISWVTLEALNEAAVRYSGYNSDLKGFTLGDDAVTFSGHKRWVRKYQLFLEKCGGVIHPEKDVTSYVGRYVLGEYMFDDNGYVDVPRASSTAIRGLWNDAWIEKRTAHLTKQVKFCSRSDQLLVRRILSEKLRYVIKENSRKGSKAPFWAGGGGWPGHDPLEDKVAWLSHCSPQAFFNHHCSIASAMSRGDKRFAWLYARDIGPQLRLDDVDGVPIHQWMQQEIMPAVTTLVAFERPNVNSSASNDLLWSWHTVPESLLPQVERKVLVQL